MHKLKFLVFLSALFIIVLGACNSGKITRMNVLEDDLNSTEQVDEILELTPSCEFEKDSLFIHFKLKVVRKQEAKEYIPNSETLRLIVINSEGEIIYNSGAGQSYFMKIEKVMPEAVGEEYTYEAFWNMKDSRGNVVPKGKYVANLIIPAKPKPYVDIIKFELK